MISFITRKKKQSHIESRRQAAEHTQHRLIALLRWDEERYCWFKYKAGLAYLNSYLKGDDFAIDQISRSRIFWNWWKNHWTIRDEVFLEDACELDRISIQLRRKGYLLMHNPGALASEITPHGIVLEESYDEMFQRILKEKQKATA